MTDSAEPRVAVLILSYNGKRWLEESVPSVLRMDYPNFEVVVIDNGSSDGTLEYLQAEFPQVGIVRLESNIGYAGGFDAGLEYAAERGVDYFLVMNNDTSIDRGALSALIGAAGAYRSAGFVTGKVYFYDRPAHLQTAGREEDPIVWSKDIGWGELDNGQYDRIAERAFADDVFLLVRKEMYDEIGGYDPDFFLQCEEWDWQLRARGKGWRVYYTPLAKIWHRVGASTGGAESPIREYFFHRNRIVVMAKHGGPVRLGTYFMVGGFRGLYSLLRGLAQMDWRRVRTGLARLLGSLAGTWWLLHRRSAKRVPWLVERLAEGQQ